MQDICRPPEASAHRHDFVRTLGTIHQARARVRVAGTVHRSSTASGQGEVIQGGSERPALGLRAQDVWDWVENEIDGSAAISKGMMNVLIKHFGYEGSRITAHSINNSFNELCFSQQNKMIKEDDGQSVRCLLLTRTAEDTHNITSYKLLLQKTNDAIKKLISQNSY